MSCELWTGRPALAAPELRALDSGLGLAPRADASSACPLACLLALLLAAPKAHGVLQALEDAGAAGALLGPLGLRPCTLLLLNPGWT